MKLFFLLTALLFLCSSSVFAQAPVTLAGSPSSMDWQSSVAESLNLIHSRDGWEIASLVNEGVLVDVNGNENYELYDVSFPFALPYVKNFIEDLAFHYHKVFGCEKMVVTSLARPKNRQPINSHPKSVHPTGMAIDIRWPRENRDCGEFLMGLLLHFEKYGKLDVTRENNPPHYHVAILSDGF